MNKNKSPIYGLELLRGLCALSVAVYHCLGWAGFEHLHTWGLYGVYIFFVISGAVMYHNYHGMLAPGGITIPRFLYKRFARLAPLFFVCVVMTAFLLHEWPAAKLVLNSSLLFGFIDPGRTSIVTGGWSLGVEFVLYVLFPVFLAFMASTRLMIAMLLGLFVMRLLAVQVTLDGRTLVEGWAGYTQAGSFLVFFFGGMALAKVNGWRHQWLFMFLAIPLFLFFGDSEEGVLTGWRGAAYSLAAIALVAGFFWSPRRPFGVALCRLVGDASYGLYLLHPIVWLVVHKFAASRPVELQIALAIAISFIGAVASLHLFEKPVKNFLLARGRAAQPAGA